MAHLRPGTLTDAPGTGRVRLGLAIPYGEVSRDDLAKVLTELVHVARVRKVILELTGGDMPISDAVQSVVWIHVRFGSIADIPLPSRNADACH